jgi:hypothetical protein
VLVWEGLLGSAVDNEVRMVAGLMLSSQNSASPTTFKAELRLLSHRASPTSPPAPDDEIPPPALTPPVTACACSRALHIDDAMAY